MKKFFVEALGAIVGLIAGGLLVLALTAAPSAHATGAPAPGVIQVTTPEETKSLAFAIGARTQALNVTLSTLDQVKTEAAPANLPDTAAYVRDYRSFLAEAGVGGKVVRFTRNVGFGGGALEGFAVIRHGKAVAVLVTIWS